MNIKEAYDILGVSEDATDEQIEKAFTIWIKRNKTPQSPSSSDDSDHMDKLVEAYNVIKSHREGPSNQEPETFSSKLSHFFTYYKLHTVSVIVLIVVCVSIIQGVLNHREEQRVLASLPDESLSVVLYGDYFAIQPDSKTVAENILTYFPSWKRVTVEAHYFPLQAESTFDLGYQQKSAAALATKKPDIYMMNKEIFQGHIQSGMFYPLSEIEASLKQSLGAENLIYSKAHGDTTEQLYGVVLEDKTVFDGMPVHDKEVVMAIRSDAENKENALKLITKLTDMQS